VLPIAYVLAVFLTGRTTPVWWIRAVVAVAVAGLVPIAYIIPS
jgi:hypothetical protein